MMRHYNPKISILLRGQHYQNNVLPSNKKWFGSFFDIIGNFKKMILYPLKEKFNVEIYISSWTSPIQYKFNKYKSIFHPIENYEKNNFKQANIILNGLNLIPNNQNDLILILRFDLLWKIPITNWFPFKANFDICMLWREGYSDWHWQNNFATDVFFAIKNQNNNLNKFKKAIEIHLQKHVNSFAPYSLHYLYPLLKPMKTIFCFNDHYSSRTGGNGMGMGPNPIYINYENNMDIKNLIQNYLLQ